MACSEVALQQIAGAHYISNVFYSSQRHNSLVFAARQIANNLLPIPKKILTFLLALCIISLERTSNNLACALQFFLCFFLLVLLCSKQAFQTKVWPKKVLKLSYFWKKRKNVFAFCCDPRPKSEILTPHPCPPFENCSLDALISEQKPSVKNRSTGPVRNRSIFFFQPFFFSILFFK